MSSLILLGTFDCHFSVFQADVTPREVAAEIGRNICKLTRSLGLRPLPVGKHRLHRGLWVNEFKHADVVFPPFKNTEDLALHRDGDLSGADMDCGLVLWASSEPTFLAPPPRIKLKANDVFLVHNMKYMHKRPLEVSPDRWAFRQRVVWPQAELLKSLVAREQTIRKGDLY